MHLLVIFKFRYIPLHLYWLDCNEYSCISLSIMFFFETVVCKIVVRVSSVWEPLFLVSLLCRLAFILLLGHALCHIAVTHQPLMLTICRPHAITNAITMCLLVLLIDATTRCILEFKMSGCGDHPSQIEYRR